MGTRADFYIGRGIDAKWLGSQAWDGYPEGITDSLLEAKTEEAFRKELTDHFERRKDVTLAEGGWPWPWEDSKTTDFSYAFDGGQVWITCFGYGWRTYEDYKVNGEKEDFWDRNTQVVFPNMKDRMRLATGADKSGVIIVG